MFKSYLSVYSFVGCIILILSAISCETASLDGFISDKQKNDEVCVVDSYLCFDNQDAFDGYLERISVGDIPKTPVGFVSLETRGRRLSAETKAVKVTTDMSEEEFAVFRAKELLIEPELFSVLDTALLVGVANRIYKVTDEGTFVFKKGTSVEQIQRYISNAPKEYLCSLDKGDEVTLSGGVGFICSYGSQAGVNDLVKTQKVSSTSGSKEYGLAGTMNLHSGYNVTTYNWKGNSIVQNILELLLIKDYIRYAELDSNHRFAVHVYNNNFGFVEASGVKAVVQEKRRFLCVNYWVPSDTKYEIATGFNYLYSRHRNFMKAGNFSSFCPTAFTGFKATNANITGTGPVTFIYGKCTAIPYISGWGSNITFCLPSITTSGVQITTATESMLKSLYETPQPKELLSVLRSAAASRGASEAPAFMMVPYPSSSSQFKNDLAFATGVRTANCTGADLKLLLKGGFSWSGGVPAPIQFNIYDILALDTFASVKWNGSWKGIRFVFN